MEENFRRKKQELIKRFEDHLKNGTSHFFEMEAYEEIINIYLLDGNFKKAMTACELAEEQYPFSTDIMLSKAQVLSNLEDYDEAMELLDKVQCLLSRCQEFYKILCGLFRHLDHGNVAGLVINYQLIVWQIL